MCECECVFVCLCAGFIQVQYTANICSYFNKIHAIVIFVMIFSISIIVAVIFVVFSPFGNAVLFVWYTIYTFPFTKLLRLFEMMARVIKIETHLNEYSTCILSHIATAPHHKPNTYAHTCRSYNAACITSENIGHNISQTMCVMISSGGSVSLLW